jgi:hypothetical protein
MSACGVTYCVDTTAVLFALFGSAESLVVVNVSWRLQPHLLGDRGVGGEKALSEPLYEEIVARSFFSSTCERIASRIPVW